MVGLIMEKGFSVHKHIVMNNRRGFYLWAVANNKKKLFDQIAKDLIPLDSFSGDRVPLDIVSQEILKITNFVNEPNLGLKVIAISELEHSPFYKVLKIALSPALNRNVEIPFVFFLRLVAHYYQILTEVVSVKVQELKNEVRLIFSPNLPKLITYHQIEGAMYGISRLIAALKNCWPDKIEFQHIPGVVDSDLYLKNFHCIPNFLKTTNQLIYIVNRKVNNKEYRLLINPLVHSIERQFPETSYKDKIQVLLSTILGFIPPTRQNIADLMSLSLKTLQRRLSQEGATFDELLLGIRKQRVIEYLQLQQFSLEQIALFLGYKAKSQFLKAFQTWFGMSPKEYRATVLHIAL